MVLIINDTNISAGLFMTQFTVISTSITEFLHRFDSVAFGAIIVWSDLPTMLLLCLTATRDTIVIQVTIEVVIYKSAHKNYW
jgi:hypothetical protein